MYSQRAQATRRKSCMLNGSPSSTGRPRHPIARYGSGLRGDTSTAATLPPTIPPPRVPAPVVLSVLTYFIQAKPPAC
eukprot:7285694-Prymnesium_polylepis.1